VPSSLLDPVTDAISATRASWGRASWGSATDGLRASWGAASWTCGCSLMTGLAMDTTRASWGRASWGSFLGESPADSGELSGGQTGGVGHVAKGSGP
jgi:hypothetical protein